MEQIPLILLHSTGSGIALVLLDGGIFSGIAGAIAMLVKITVVLIGIVLALVIYRLISNIPRFLEILPELVMHRIVRAVVWCGSSLMQFVFNRAFRTLQYYWDTDEARRYRYRIKMRIEAIKSIFQTKS